MTPGMEKSKLRKAFHRLCSPNLLEPIQLPDGGVGLYVNITAGESDITLRYYPADGKQGKARTVPSEIEYSGK